MLINLNAVTIDDVEVTPSNIYQYKEECRLRLSQDAEVSWWADNEPQLVELKYVYGVYPLPRPIKRLCICIAGIKTLISQIAGTYDDFTSVSLPAGFNASKGEPYMNIKSALDYLQGEAMSITGSQTSSKGETGVQAQRSFGVYRPFTLFG